MISRNLERIAIDANVILSVVIGGKSLKAIQVLSQEWGVQLITTQSVMDEVKEYIPILAVKRNINEIDMVRLLRKLPLAVVDENTFAHKGDAAATLIGKRDKDDIPLLSVGLAYCCPIWSNDSDLKDIKEVEVYTIAEMLAITDSKLRIVPPSLE